MTDSVRTGKICELNVLQHTKNNFLDLLNDLKNGYFSGALIEVNMDTKSYNKTYKGQSIQIDPYLFKEYVSKEIECIEAQIQSIVKSLI